MRNVKLIVDFIISVAVLFLGLSFLVFTNKIQVFLASDMLLKSPLKILRPYTAQDAMNNQTRISLKFIGTLLVVFAILLLLVGFKEIAKDLELWQSQP